jgi:hypothetical protein
MSPAWARSIRTKRGVADFGVNVPGAQTALFGLERPSSLRVLSGEVPEETTPEYKQLPYVQFRF